MGTVKADHLWKRLHHGYFYKKYNKEKQKPNILQPFETFSCNTFLFMVFFIYICNIFELAI